VACQVNLQSPQSRDGNANIRVLGSLTGINPCGNGSDAEIRASQSPVATYLNGGNATNISIQFYDLSALWTMSIVSYTNYTGVINPNATIPLPIASSNIVLLRAIEQVGVTTNGSLGTYMLRDFLWPVAAAAACRPNYYGCALRIVTTNPSGNVTYFTCSDIRVYSHAFDARLVFTVSMDPGVAAPAPSLMLSRLIGAYGNKGLTTSNSIISPSTAFSLRSDQSFTFTVIVSDEPGFTSDEVVASISKDASTTLVNTLGVATVVLGNPPAVPSSAGSTAAIVIIILLLLAMIGVLVYVKLKKPLMWKAGCDKLSACFSSCRSACGPAKGTNI